MLVGAAAALPFASGRVFAAPEPERLRIGFQKSSTLTIFLKSRGLPEKVLAPLKVDVQWHEFTSGLPLLEALNIGAVDLSADVADAVPPFALAAGAKLTYYAIETPSPQAQAIVVRKDSPIASIAQIKGRKVAFAKGSGAHYLILEALARASCRTEARSPATAASTSRPRPTRSAEPTCSAWSTPNCSVPANGSRRTPVRPPNGTRR